MGLSSQARQEKIDRLTRQILALLHKNPTGPLLGKLNKLLEERAALEREKASEIGFGPEVNIKQVK